MNATWTANKHDPEAMKRRIKLLTGEDVTYEGSGIVTGGLAVRVEQPLWDIVISITPEGQATMHNRRPHFNVKNSMMIYGFRRPGGVKVVRNYMDRDRALELADLCEKELEWNRGRVRNGEIPSDNIRYAMGGSLDKNRSTWEAECHDMVNVLASGFDLRSVEAKVNAMFYPEGKNGHYVWHLDNSHDYFDQHPDIITRQNSVIVALRQADEGGEIEATRLLGENGEILRRWDDNPPNRDDAPSIMLEPGDAAVFPSDETYHRILPTLKGSRLSLVSWHPAI